MELISANFDISIVKEFKCHKSGVTAVDFHPNGREVVSGSYDTKVHLTNIFMNKVICFNGHTGGVMDVSFCNTGTYMASASRDKTIRVWMPNDILRGAKYPVHSNIVRSVQYSSCTHKIVTGSDDQTVKLWSRQNNKLISTYSGHEDIVGCARMALDGKVIASCSFDASTRLWDVMSKSCIHKYNDHRGVAHCISWHPNGHHLILGTSMGNVRVYDTRTHKLVQYYDIHTDTVTKLTIHPSGKYMLTSSLDCNMKIFDLMQGCPLYTIERNKGPVTSCIFSKTGTMFASGYADGRVCVWRMKFSNPGNVTKKRQIKS